MRVLVLGGTGSIGRHVVRQALQAGHNVVALVRDPARAATLLPEDVTLVQGDLTTGAGVIRAVDGIDAIVSTLDGDAHQVDFNGTLRVLRALDGRRVHISLMTLIGAANVGVDELIDWKRRTERLVRASGNDFTIARPGWFDMNTPEQQSLHLFQGEQRWSLTPEVGVIGRDQIARVLVGALTTESAKGKTFDLVAEHGPAQESLHDVFAPLRADRPGDFDCVWDPDNMPLNREPVEVRRALDDFSPTNC